MKILTGQTHVSAYGNFAGLTTIALDDLAEANALVKAALGNPEFLKKSYHDCMNIVLANRGRGAANIPKPKIGWMKDALEESLDQIENGNTVINANAIKLADSMIDAAKNIEPSLTQEQTYQPSEEGELWDAGKIASNDPIAFFSPNRTDRPKSGRGDGAFRILINTDVGWWADPTTQVAALMAIVTLLQRQAPVEIWIQQGWLGDSTTDGITLFKIFSGGAILPQHLYFWIGSPYKDSPYSYIVNQMLRRVKSRVSMSPELPCDLYIYGSFMPKIKNIDAWNDWVAKTARPMLFDEEMPDGWSGYLSKLPE